MVGIAPQVSMGAPNCPLVIGLKEKTAKKKSKSNSTDDAYYTIKLSVRVKQVNIPSL